MTLIQTTPPKPKRHLLIREQTYFVDPHTSWDRGGVEFFVDIDDGNGKFHSCWEDIGVDSSTRKYDFEKVYIGYSHMIEGKEYLTENLRSIEELEGELEEDDYLFQATDGYNCEISTYQIKVLSEVRYNEVERIIEEYESLNSLF